MVKREGRMDRGEAVKVINDGEIVTLGTERKKRYVRMEGRTKGGMVGVRMYRKV